MTPPLQDALPTRIYTHLNEMQEAGAAVETSLDRIEKLFRLLEGRVEADNGPKDDRPLPVRTPSLCSLPSTPASPAELMDPLPTLESVPERTGCSMELFYSECVQYFGGRVYLRSGTPGTSLARPSDDARVSCFRAEMMTVKEKDLVRLRHCMRRVENDWREILDDYRANHHDSDAVLEAVGILKSNFEAYMADKKRRFTCLTSRVSAMSTTMVLGSQWGGGA